MEISVIFFYPEITEYDVYYRKLSVVRFLYVNKSVYPVRDSSNNKSSCLCRTCSDISLFFLPYFLFPGSMFLVVLSGIGLTGSKGNEPYYNICDNDFFTVVENVFHFILNMY